MIVCRTPYRISFFGGGTDFPKFYESEPAAVFSACIDKYITIQAKESDLERESGLYFLRWKTMSEVGSGTGLGNSSALAVSYIHLIRHGQTDKIRLAEDAYDFETKIMRNPTGKQDHLAVALGGLNKIVITSSGVRNYRYSCRQLFKHLLLFAIPRERTGNEINLHIENIEKNRAVLREMRDQVDEAASLLESEDYRGFGLLLHHSWELKKRLSGDVTSPKINELYNRALKAGAIGGKMCGSGGGGHLLLMLEDPGKRNIVLKELRELREIPIRFERQGSMVYFCGAKD